MSIANALFDYFQTKIGEAEPDSPLYEADLIQSIYAPIVMPKTVRLLDAFSVEYSIAREFEIFETNYLTGIQVIQIPDGDLYKMDARFNTVQMVKEVVKLLAIKDILGEFINKVETLKAIPDEGDVQGVASPYIEQALIINEF